MDIDGAVIFITGASSGIGAATARAAAKGGARVVLAARRQDRISALASELPDALAVACDVTDLGQVHTAVAAAIERYERIDVLVNNAGRGLQAPVDQIDLDAFRGLLELNLVAPLAMIQAVVPIMRRQGGGAIINLGSGTTFAPLPGSAAYAASKSALQQLSDIARVDLADDGIVVSALLPFLTDTEFTESLVSGADAAREMNESLSAQTPEDVARAIIDLIHSGEERADLVPVAYGGSLED